MTREIQHSNVSSHTNTHHLLNALNKMQMRIYSQSVYTKKQLIFKAVLFGALILRGKFGGLVFGVAFAVCLNEIIIKYGM